MSCNWRLINMLMQENELNNDVQFQLTDQYSFPFLENAKYKILFPSLQILLYMYYWWTLIILLVPSQLEHSELIWYIAKLICVN